MPNVDFFQDHLAFQICQAQRHSRQLAVLVVDLQSFESVRNLLGDAGIRNLLVSSSRRIMRELRDHDVVAQAVSGSETANDRIISRIDADRFIVLISEFQHIKDVSAIVERIIAVVAKPISVGEQQMVPNPKVGISLFPSDGEDAGVLIRNASSALEFSLDHQLGRYGFFAESDNKQMADRFSLETRLRQAIDDCAFELHYQPKVALESGATIGLEALIRWRDPKIGEISPARFIPLAEELGFIHELSRWVVREACLQCRRWLNEGVPTVPVAVNLSGQDFLRSDFPDFVTTVLLENEIAPQNLELEITEGVVIENLAVAAAMLEELRKIGVKIALDDFGTGYSSLSYLHRIPIDTLKIDRSFIRHITSDWNCAAITSGVITLSHILNLNVVAEGVETLEQVELLKDQNCNAVQGAVYSMPMSAEMTTEWLRTQSQG
jgi:EAL domain-containing protein (putative c-di-GMP-specific phosphodiesterase class I)/GGDEF domain-containing protein